jgi:lipoyl(octanoyl) transferase 2
MAPGSSLAIRWWISVQLGWVLFALTSELSSYWPLTLRPKLSTRCYVSHLESFLSTLVSTLSVPVYPLEHTGVFTSPTSKIASIGIHIRRRISLHGFSINVEEQTRKWFDAVVACGLADVNATSVEAVWRELGMVEQQGGVKKVNDIVPLAVELIGRQYGRSLKALEEGDEFGELREMIQMGTEGRLPELEKKNLA